MNGNAPPFKIQRVALDPIEWSHSISFDNAIAQTERARVVRFAEELDQDPLVDKAVHDRPATILVLAPTIDEELLETVAARAWARVGNDR